MTTSDINDFRSKSTKYIAEEQLCDAFSIMRSNAAKLNNSKLLDDVTNLETSFKFLLQYFTNGSDDPDRFNQHDKILYNARILADRIYREMCYLADTSSYYNTLKYTRLRPEETIPALVEKYRNELARLDYDLAAVASPTYRAQAERIACDLFNLMWVTFPYSVADTDNIRGLLADDKVPDYTKEMLVGAIMLGLLQFYDYERFNMLFFAYENCNTSVAAAALTCIVICLYRYRKRDLHEPLIQQLKSYAEGKSWSQDLTTVFIELVRGYDTENLNRFMQEEILPNMIQMGSTLYDKIKKGDINPTDIESLEANPEWDDLLYKKGFADKFKTFTESQLDGDDLFLSTFQGMKTDAFFRDVANWFMPFHPDHSAIAETVISMTKPGEQSSVADMLAQAPMMCDNDKYSMMFQFARMPETERQSAFTQMPNMPGEDMFRNDAPVDDAKLFKNNVNRWVKNYYRFFKLYRRKGDFFNPFDEVISPMDIDLLSENFDRKAVGNFMFKRKLYSKVYDLFNVFGLDDDVDYKFYQKLGYCAEKEGHQMEALEHYRHAESLQPGNRWTLRRMARIYSQYGEFNEAIDTFKKLLEIDPDDVNILLNYGTVLMNFHLYDEALPIFYQAEYSAGSSAKAWRPIAWLLLLSKDYDGALTYYKRIIEESPIAEDYFNMGHLMWARGDLHQAISYYRQYIKLNEGMTLEQFGVRLQQDLVQIDRPESMNLLAISLILDAIRYDELGEADL